MACKIDETVKLIDELIESKEWIKYNKTSGLPEDNKKLKEAIAKLKSFKSLKMQSQGDKSPGSNDTETSRENRFNKYISDVFTDELYNDITQLVKDNKLNDAAGKITGTYNRIGLNDNYEYEDNVDTDNLRNDIKEYVSKSISSSVLNDTRTLTQNMVNKLFKKVIGRNYEIQPGITASEGQKKLIDKGIEFLQNEKKASKIGENVMIVQGRGGTGKTSSISRVLINYINENSNSSRRKTPNILMMTLSHQAKDVLNGMSKQIFEETRVQPKVEVIAGAMAWYATDDDIKSKSIVFEDKKISYKNKDKNIDGVYKSSVASAVNGDIIVVDEASMLDSAELAYLLEKTKDGVKVILMGDYHQTKIVDPKTGDFSASGSTNTGYSKVFDHFTGVKDPLLKNAEVVELTEIHRQKEGSNILDFADYYADTVDYGLGNIKIKPTVPIANGNEVKYINRSDIVDSFVSDYNKGKNVVYIAHSNKDVTIVNKDIRQKLSKNPKDEYSVGDMMIAYSNYVIDGDGPIITNSERLIIKKIDDATKEEKSKEKISQKVGFATQEFKYKEDVKLKKLTLERVNGDSNSMPLVVFVPSGLLNSVISKFEANTNAGKNFDTLYKDELIRFFEPTNNTKSTKTPTIRKDSLTSVSAGAGLSYGYAVTAHKSQGSTVDIVYTTLSSDPNVSYVAVTRAREKVYIIDNAKANNSSSNSVNNTVESKNDSTTTPGSENEVQEQNNDNKIIKEEFDEALKKAHESKEMITLQNSFIGRNAKFNEPSRKYGDLIDKLVNGTVSGVNKYNILIDSNGNEIELYDPLNEEYKKEKQKIIEKYTEGLTYNNYGDEFDFYNPISYKQFSKDDIDYQKESKYPTYNLNSIKFSDIDLEETRKFNKLMKIRNDIEAGLKELYPEIKVDYLNNITDNSGLSVLGRAIGNVIELNTSNLGIDTVPHEYAHIYINVLSGTDTISNILKAIKIKRNVTNEEAKEILAKKIGELYVDDEIKLSNKDIYLIEKVWKFIVETFKKLVGGEKYKKELEEINGIKIVYQDFKTGKYKKDFADRLDSYVFASNMKNSTDKKDKELENVEQEKDIEQAVYLMSPELSKYGTLKDYKKYVSEIFPESKIDYIVAHDTGSIGSMFSSGRDAKNLPFTDSWLYSDDVNITGKGENYGLVSGEGFYTYKPNKRGEKWDQYSQFTGYIKLDIRNPLDSKSKEYIDLPGKTYYEKMSNLTNTELQSNPDEWYMLDNPPEKVTINSIVNEKTGYDGFINEVRRGLFEHVAWKNEQVHILGSKKDIEGFKQYAIDNSLKSGGLSLSDNNTVLLPVAKPEIINEIKDEMRGFKTKEEFHITLVGFPQGKYLSKEIEKMEYKDFATYNINKALLEIDTSYKLKNEFYQVERDREAFIDYRNPDLGKTIIHEKSLIQLVDAPGLIEGIKKINKDFNINLPIPFPHITLATKGGLGIGIPNKEEFDKLTKSKIDLLPGSESEIQAYKQFSKDDIEAAKDIMAKNKKECE